LRVAARGTMNAKQEPTTHNQKKTSERRIDFMGE
jgi:hypothetical protein